MLLQGSVAYVPQQAWIQNLTVRDNIVFGREFKAAKYRKVVENCCLKSDLDMLAHGDKTELGEKASPWCEMAEFASSCICLLLTT